MITSALKLNGFKEHIGDKMTFEVMRDATGLTNDYYSDWPEDQGFGSSDFTSAIKTFVDFVIYYLELPLKTSFTPTLSVVTK